MTKKFIDTMQYLPGEEYDTNEGVTKFMKDFIDRIKSYIHKQYNAEEWEIKLLMVPFPGKIVLSFEVKAKPPPLERRGVFTLPNGIKFETST